MQIAACHALSSIKHGCLFCAVRSPPSPSFSYAPGSSRVWRKRGSVKTKIRQICQKQNRGGRKQRISMPGCLTAALHSCHGSTPYKYVLHSTEEDQRVGYSLCVTVAQHVQPIGVKSDAIQRTLVSQNGVFPHASTSSTEGSQHNRCRVLDFVRNKLPVFHLAIVPANQRVSSIVQWGRRPPGTLRSQSAPGSYPSLIPQGRHTMSCHVVLPTVHAQLHPRQLQLPNLKPWPARPIDALGEPIEALRR